jgi:hypothetical protein
MGDAHTTGVLTYSLSLFLWFSVSLFSLSLSLSPFLPLFLCFSLLTIETQHKTNNDIIERHRHRQESESERQSETENNVRLPHLTGFLHGRYPVGWIAAVLEVVLGAEFDLTQDLRGVLVHLDLHITLHGLDELECGVQQEENDAHVQRQLQVSAEYVWHVHELTKHSGSLCVVYRSAA